MLTLYFVRINRALYYLLIFSWCQLCYLVGKVVLGIEL